MSKVLASSKPDKRPARALVAKPRALSPEANILASIFGPAVDRGTRGPASRPTARQSTKSAESAPYRNFVELYRADPMARVSLVKTGVPAAGFVSLATDLHMPKERLASTLGLARATVDRKIRGAKVLSTDESSRVLGMASLIGQVQSMVAESGRPEGFDAGAWVSNWLEQPVPALGGRRPAEFMDTPEGQGIVSGLVAQMQSGAYA